MVCARSRRTVHYVLFRVSSIKLQKESRVSYVYIRGYSGHNAELAAKSGKKVNE